MKNVFLTTLTILCFSLVLEAQVETTRKKIDKGRIQLINSCLFWEITIVIHEKQDTFSCLNIEFMSDAYSRLRVYKNFSLCTKEDVELFLLTIQKAKALDDDSSLEAKLRKDGDVELYVTNKKCRFDYQREWIVFNTSKALKLIEEIMPYIKLFK